MLLDPFPENALSGDGVARVLRATLGKEARDVVELGNGAFGRVFRADLGTAGDVIVKLFRFGGFASDEHRALEALRARSPIAVPEPLAFLAREDGPEALVMSFLPGSDARALATLTGTAAGHAADQIVDLLNELHAGVADAFGSCEHPNEPSWGDCFIGWLTPYRSALERDGASGDGVADAAAKSWARAETILASAPRAAVLVHGDFCLGNLLYDADTMQLTGLIDPLDAVWGDPVLDLIHLTKSNGHRLQLLERYAARADLDDDAMRRYWFYMFWRWLSYQMRLGIDAGDWIETSARRLLDVLDP